MAKRRGASPAPFLRHAEGQPAQRQGVALLIVALVLRPHLAEQQLAALHPIFIDAVPLSLEEIFIYELGGEDYAIRDIVL